MILKRLGILAVVAMSLAAGGTAQAQLSEEEGFFLFLDTVFTTPRNTDQVIAINVDTGLPPPTSGDVQSTETILTGWGSDPAGQLEFGYRWASGNMVSLTYWGYEADQRTRGDGPEGNTMYFGIGPTIISLYEGPYYYYNYSYGSFGYSGHHDIVSKIDAKSLTIEAGHTHELSEGFELEWSLGLRWASFEENLDGFYDYYESTNAYFGYLRYAASKTNESTMAGFKIGGKGSYEFNRHVSVNSSLAFSFLQGEVTSTSGLVPDERLGLPSSLFELTDNDRTGTITDFDINVVWHLSDDRYRVWAGYAYSSWDGLAVDLSRKSFAIEGEQVGFGVREGVAFSGFKIGVGFLF
jgi:hypothetical protein